MTEAPQVAKDLVSRAVEQVLSEGWTIFEGVYSEHEVSFFRELLVAQWEAVGSPPLSAKSRRPLVPGIDVGATGMAILNLTKRHPEAASRLFKPTIIETLRGVLGRDMRCELAAGSLSDFDRPFFDWHVHTDGIDDARIGYSRKYRQFTRAERVTTLLYLDDINDDNGTLLIYPRKIEDPTPPPYDVRLHDWEGLVELRCRRGSFVILEQNTWHAVRPKRVPGLRAFVGCFFASSSATPSPLTEEDPPRLP